MKIMFEKGKASITVSTDKLDKVVAYLTENIDEKVKVSGYIDESENAVAKLAGKRVGAVYKYLVSKGIEKTRIERKIGGSDSPVDKKEVIKNMRVEIAVIPM